MIKIPASVLCDFYKISHRPMFVKTTQVIYDTWTPRASKIVGVNEVVVFGNQAFIQEWLVDFFNDNFFSRPKTDVLAEYARIIKHTLGDKNPDVSHLAALHDLGYLPLLIKALPEGTVVPIRTPVMTVQNTKDEFFWLPGYIESLASSEIWPGYTAATIAHEYRKLLDVAALKTVGNTDFVQFQGHDFSLRGMMGISAAVKTGMGHLLSFVGSDTIPAGIGAEHYYGADIEKELVLTSIPASEHSIQCTYEDDTKYFTELLTKVHPSGFVSIVSDGYDFWDVIGRVIPSLKDTIMARDGRCVIRPDSGVPELIVCGNPNGKTELERKGAVEALWDVFGGTVTEKGYKLLDSHIGLIYGDSITLDRAKKIVDRLEAKGFASINCVLGIGSFTYQYVTRDTFGFALKTTNSVIDGKEKHIFKDPKTDDGVKKSQKGAVHVYRDNGDGGDGKIKWSDGHSIADVFADDLMRPIFKDGKALNVETFAVIRKRLVEQRENKVEAVAV